MKPTFIKRYGSEKPHLRSVQVIRDEKTMFHDACDAAKSNRVRVQPGKGSKQRPTNKNAYDKHFDQIKWN